MEKPNQPSVATNYIVHRNMYRCNPMYTRYCMFFSIDCIFLDMFIYLQYLWCVCAHFYPTTCQCVYYIYIYTCVSVCRWHVRSSVHVHICFVEIHRVSLLDNLLLVDRLKASITTPMKASITTLMIRHLSLWRATTLCDASHFPPSGKGIATLVPAIKIYLA